MKGSRKTKSAKKIQQLHQIISSSNLKDHSTYGYHLMDQTEI